MSSAAVTEAELVTLLSQSFIETCVSTAAACLLLYELVITFSDVVMFIWERKRTAVTVLFVLNYFCSLGYGVSLVLGVPNWSSLGSCEAASIMFYVFSLLLCLVWAAFSALRVYAVGNCASKSALLTLLLSLVPFTVNVYNLSAVSVVTTALPQPIGHGCIISSHIPVAVIVIAVRSCAITADLTVLVVTWYNTYSIVREVRLLSMNTPVVMLLIQDGTMYFIVLLLLNVVQIMISFLNSYGEVSLIVTSLWAIIVSRFLVSLRKVAQNSPNTARPSFVASQASDIRFASSFIGPMGAPLSGSFGLSSLSGGDADEAVDDEGHEEEHMAGRDERDRTSAEEIELGDIARDDVVEEYRVV